MTATLFSTSPIVSRNIKTDPDFRVYSRCELARFAELQTRVREFDMFSFEGTLWLEKEWVQIPRDCLAFMNDLQTSSEDEDRVVTHKGRTVAFVKRNVLVMLLFAEFLTSNVFQVSYPDLIPVYENFIRATVPAKFLEFADCKYISKEVSGLFREHLDTFQTRLRALKVLPVGASPVLEYSQEWLTATGRAYFEYPYETITETYH